MLVRSTCTSWSSLDHDARPVSSSSWHAHVEQRSVSPSTTTTACPTCSSSSCCTVRRFTGHARVDRPGTAAAAPRGRPGRGRASPGRSCGRPAVTRVVHRLCRSLWLTCEQQRVPRLVLWVVRAALAPRGGRRCRRPGGRRCRRGAAYPPPGFCVAARVRVVALRHARPGAAACRHSQPGSAAGTGTGSAAGRRGCAGRRPPAARPRPLPARPAGPAPAARCAGRRRPRTSAATRSTASCRRRRRGSQSRSALAAPSHGIGCGAGLSPCSRRSRRVSPCVQGACSSYAARTAHPTASPVGCVRRPAAARPAGRRAVRTVARDGVDVR